MTYTSLSFFLFSFVLINLFWIVPHKFQKYLLLLANIIFLNSFSTKSLIWALVVSAISFYLVKISIKRDRNVYRYLGVLLLIASFLLFKFTNGFVEIINKVGNNNFNFINIFVPIGFSFYMIQQIMYLYDAGKKYKEEKNLFKYFAYSTSFLTVIQGPIADYENYGNQFWDEHEFNQDRFFKGFKLVILGVFKKLIIANRANLVTSKVFGLEEYNLFFVMFGGIAYTIELYFDFSGAVDISRGLAFMLDLVLPINFDRPYFSTSIKSFWKRWHITLTTFFTKFVYIPLGGNRKGLFRHYCNIIIVFLVSSVWHGVGLNFVVWGLLHASFQIVEDILNKNKCLNQYKSDGIISSNNLNYKNLASWLLTMSLVVISWIFFRASSLSVAIEMLSSLTKISLNGIDKTSLGIGVYDFMILLFSGISILYLEFINSSFISQYPTEKENLPVVFLTVIIIFIMIFGIYGPGYNSTDFIYMGF